MQGSVCSYSLLRSAAHRLHRTQRLQVEGLAGRAPLPAEQLLHASWPWLLLLGPLCRTAGQAVFSLSPLGNCLRWNVPLLNPALVPSEPPQNILSPSMTTFLCPCCGFSSRSVNQTAWGALLSPLQSTSSSFIHLLSRSFIPSSSSPKRDAWKHVSSISGKRSPGSAPLST